MLIDEPRHNPQRSQTQCNFIVKTILSPQRELVGFVPCPKSVWAEYRMLMSAPVFYITTEGIHARIQNQEIPQGWYCAEHWFQILTKRKASLSPNP